MYSYTPENSRFDGPITNLLSTLRSFVEILSRAAHAKGEKKLQWFQIWHFHRSFSERRRGKRGSKRVNNRVATDVPSWQLKLRVVLTPSEPEDSSPEPGCRKDWLKDDDQSRCINRYLNGGVAVRALELWESRGGRPGLPVPNSPYGLWGCKPTLNCSISKLWSCVKVEVDVLGSTCLTVLTVSVDVKLRAQELWESRGSRPELPVPNSPYGLSGCRAIWTWTETQQPTPVLFADSTDWCQRC